MPGQRQDCLSWPEFIQIKDDLMAQRDKLNISDDDLYMRLALLVANCSPDPSTQVGAVVVSSSGNFITYGYNQGCISDQILPWKSIGEITGVDADIKDHYIYHAEVIALAKLLMLGCTDDVKTLYVTFSPCEACLRMCALFGVKKIIYHMPYTHTNEIVQNRIIEYNGIVIREYNCSKNSDESIFMSNELRKLGYDNKEIKKYQRGMMKCLKKNN